MVVLVMGGGKSLMTLISTPFISLVDSSKGRGWSNSRPLLTVGQNLEKVQFREAASWDCLNQQCSFLKCC